jgi:hypothetical protein
MNWCDSCETLILFGGHRRAGGHYCGERCLRKGFLTFLAARLPNDAVRRRTARIMAAGCPKCGRPGAVEVHTAYRVWSAVYFTSRSHQAQLCCQRCGIKSQVWGLLFSSLFGWWGFPWGLLWTPVQIVRNILGMFGATTSLDECEADDLVRADLAESLVAAWLRASGHARLSQADQHALSQLESQIAVMAASDEGRAEG